jgi:hypothetical protein
MEILTKNITNFDLKMGNLNNKKILTTKWKFTHKYAKILTKKYKRFPKKFKKLSNFTQKYNF